MVGSQNGRKWKRLKVEVERLKVEVERLKVEIGGEFIDEDLPSDWSPSHLRHLRYQTKNKSNLTNFFS